MARSPHAGCGGSVRRVEKRLQFVACQPVDQCLVGALFRNGVHLSGQVKALWSGEFQEFE